MNDETDTDVGSTSSLKVLTITIVGGTLVTPLPGAVESTTGGVVSAFEPVVKDHEYGMTMPLPARSAILVPRVTV